MAKNGESAQEAEIIENGDGTATVKFKVPATIDGISVPQVIMREPTVQDQLTAKNGRNTDEETEIALLANLTELSPDAIKGLSMRNYTLLQRAYTSFLE